MTRTIETLDPCLWMMSGPWEDPYSIHEDLLASVIVSFDEEPWDPFYVREEDIVDEIPWHMSSERTGGKIPFTLVRNKRYPEAVQLDLYGNSAGG